MTTLTFLIGISGGVFLMLYAVRMVQTGMERALGPSLRRMLGAATRNRLSSALAGAGLSMSFQSATAASLLIASFVAAGSIVPAMGLVAVLGADVGSSLVIQLLSLRPEGIIPLLLAAGGWLFLRTESRGTRQSGRILVGIAFILLSLRLISEATDPIRDSALLAVIAEQLGTEFVAAFLVGVLITLMMHSSVAAILVCLAFVQSGVLPATAGLSVVLGANLGAALLLVWLSRQMPVEARRIAMGNLLVRGTAAILVQGALELSALAPLMDRFLAAQGEAQAVVSLHVLFNAGVLLLGLPLAGFLRAPLLRLLPEPAPDPQAELMQRRSLLDPTVTGIPNLALACATREVLRLGTMIEAMARPVMDLYHNGTPESIRAVQAVGKEVNTTMANIRAYIARLDTSLMSAADLDRGQNLSEYAINLEAAGDILAKRLLKLALEKRAEGLTFSDAGWAEIQEMHTRLIANIALSQSVLLTGDPDLARRLMDAKREMTTFEVRSREQHLIRLRDGRHVSFESSDLHLETLRALKDANSHIAAVAYSVGGQSAGGAVQATAG